MIRDWEAEPDKNLLFSFVIFPVFLEARQQFLISQIVSLAIKEELDTYTTDISIKWPNDIYWKDKELLSGFQKDWKNHKTEKKVLIRFCFPRIATLSSSGRLKVCNHSGELFCLLSCAKSLQIIVGRVRFIDMNQWDRKSFRGAHHILYVAF